MIGQGTYSSTDLRNEVKVGNYSSIAANVVFGYKDDNHLCKFNKDCVYTTNWGQPEDGREIEIGNDTWIGRNVLILPGIKIGDGVIIGAGTVVTKDVPDFAIVVGNTGRIIKYRFNKEQREKLKKMKWWEWTDETVKERKKDMLDVDKFIELYG